MIEVARPEVPLDQRQTLPVNPSEIQALVEEYSIATSGLVELFEHEELLEEMKLWASGLTTHSDDVASAVFFLVLSIGAQEGEEEKAEAWFTYARDLLLKHMCNSMNVATVQGFTLVAIFMLRAFQPNGAYLYFCKYHFTLLVARMHAQHKSLLLEITKKTGRLRYLSLGFHEWHPQRMLKLYSPY